ncbi:MAG: hypothetical protein HY823_01875 [Acidobacteria bacterium]|nr:hypothetical protein [Acidobacteriota bacterium]
MSASLRGSATRAWIGAALAAAGLLVALFVLPGLSQDLSNQQRARDRAEQDLRQQEAELQGRKALAGRLAASEGELQTLEKQMSQKSIGQLQWDLSKALHDLSTEHGIRLQAVKYQAPNREAAKGTDLESLDVEFNALGVYASLKSFMLALERSGQPFAVGAVKLDESPEGARLTVLLRAFRKAGAKAPVAEEGA